VSEARSVLFHSQVDPGLSSLCVHLLAIFIGSPLLCSVKLVHYISLRQ